MDIKVIGPGSPDSEKLYHMATEISYEIGLQDKVEKVEDIDQIMKYEVMMTPALMINGELRVHGSLPTREQIKELIEREL